MKKTDLFFAFILLPLDIIMIVASFVLSYYFRVDLEIAPAFSSEIVLGDYLRYSFFILPIWIGLFAVNGLYYIRGNSSFAREFYRILVGSSTAVLMLIVVIYLSHTTFFSRIILIFIWALSVALIGLSRLIIRLVRQYLYKFGIGRKNLLIIGDNSTSRDLDKELNLKSDLGYKVQGVLILEGEHSKYGLKVLGNFDLLSQRITQYGIDEVVLTDINISKSKIAEIIRICSDKNIAFKYIPDTFSLMAYNVTSGLMGSMPVMELKHLPLDGWGRIIKRVIDFVFSLLFVIILSPIFILIALLEKITSKGPVIYSQDRVGRDENKFKCYKFRSMYSDKCDFSKDGSQWTTKKDQTDRITPLGRILRKTNLDELPQLVNILKGDMSFVGPRPELPKFVQQFESEIPEYFKRHHVKSGLTGWAQVNGLKGDTSIKERVRYDIYYIENWSFLFDLKIILRTIWLVIYETIVGKYEYRSNS